MLKCTVIGKFAYGYNILDGQTVKCDMIYKELIEKYGDDNISYVDTYKWKNNIVKTIKNSYNSIKNSNNIIIMPAHNGIKIFAPFFVFLNIFFKRKLHYVVIGSWLYNKVIESNFLKKNLKKFDNIYVETSKLKSDLENIGFTNIVKMNNYKKLEIIEKFPKFIKKDIINICTFSRVNYNKGIEDIINSVKEINSDVIKIELDIYGQIDKDYEERFLNIINISPDYISYKGLINADESVNYIKKYDLLAFPTKYFTEGIPGTIIDAYASGVPVISSKWENYSDIVIENVTGLLFEMNNVDELKDKLLYAYDNQNKIYEMKKNCLLEAKKYCYKDTLNVLFEKIK